MGIPFERQYSTTHLMPPPNPIKITANKQERNKAEQNFQKSASRQSKGQKVSAAKVVASQAFKFRKHCKLIFLEVKCFQ